MRIASVVLVSCAAVLAAGCASGSSKDLECGPGTIEIDGVCRPQSEGTVISCGPGTHEEDGRCLADPSGGGLTCGAGTHEQDGECVGDSGGDTCGPGMVEQDGQCVPRASWYEMRTTVAAVGADGISKIPILLIGENADGTPATSHVVLSVRRSDAGQFLQTTATLAPTGTTVFYRPCNAIDSPLCAGPVELDMFLPGDLDKPVASLALELLEPTGVFTPASCLIGGNVMFFDGNSHIYHGTLLVTEGDWTVGSATDDAAAIHFEPAGQQNGLWWDFTFSAEQLDVALLPGVYEMAERWPFESTDRPGLDVAGDGRFCDTISGRFQVHEYARTGTSIDSLTVSFEQHCEGGASDILYGCIHIEE